MPLSDNTRLPWSVEAQVEGGKVATGTVYAPAGVSRNYLLMRFLAGHIKNPGRRYFWYHKNKDRAVIKRISLPVDTLPDPDPQMTLF